MSWNLSSFKEKVDHVIKNIFEDQDYFDEYPVSMIIPFLPIKGENFEWNVNIEDHEFFDEDNEEATFGEEVLKILKETGVRQISIVKNDRRRTYEIAVSNDDNLLSLVHQ